jgi:hypothetical protein
MYGVRINKFYDTDIIKHSLNAERSQISWRENMVNIVIYL